MTSSQHILLQKFPDGTSPNCIAALSWDLSGVQAFKKCLLLLALSYTFSCTSWSHSRRSHSQPNSSVSFGEDFAPVSQVFAFGMRSPNENNWFASSERVGSRTNVPRRRKQVALVALLMSSNS